MDTTGTSDTEAPQKPWSPPRTPWAPETPKDTTGPWDTSVTTGEGDTQGHQEHQRHP